MIEIKFEDYLTEDNGTEEQVVEELELKDFAIDAPYEDTSVKICLS